MKGTGSYTRKGDRGRMINHPGNKKEMGEAKMNETLLCSSFFHIVYFLGIFVRILKYPEIGENGLSNIQLEIA